MISPIRRALLGLLVPAAMLAGTRPAVAQGFSTSYAPFCDPTTGCNQVRFFLTAGSTDLFLESLTLSLLNSDWSFTSAAGGWGTFEMEDEWGPYGGFTRVTGGTSLFIDFLDTGDPANPGFPFELVAGNTGFIQVGATNGAGATTTDDLSFSYLAELKEGGTLQGTVDAAPPTLTPEPLSMVLLGTGLAGLGAVRRRKRRREELV